MNFDLTYEMNHTIISSIESSSAIIVYMNCSRKKVKYLNKNYADKDKAGIAKNPYNFATLSNGVETLSNCNRVEWLGIDMWYYVN